jgi:DNA-binding SARP family transcriptional activator/tetratricopeptide (TPR) repeat protein
MADQQPLELRLLGRFVVLRDGLEIASGTFGGRKVRALIRILASQRGRFVSHDALTEMLWGDRPPSDPAANLQVLVNRARRALGRPGVVLTGPGGYALAAGSGCTVDTEEFLAAVSRSQHVADRVAQSVLRDALASWGGEPLAEDAYAEWATEFRARLQQSRQHALERCAQLDIESGDASRAVELASIAANAEPLREVAVLTLVRALALAGDRVAALARYDAYRQTLADELGLDPSEEAAELQGQLLRGALAGHPQAAANAPDVPFGELDFVGRRAELAELVAATDPQHGGVAFLAGASGAGKSRILERLATRMPAVTARAFPAERAEPWSMARTLLREVLANDATATDAMPNTLYAALASLLPELEPRAGAPHARRALLDAESRRVLLLEAALRLLATVTDSIIIVDDLQWADPTSVALIEAALARLPQLATVIAYRPEEVPVGSDVREFIDRLHRCVQVRLGPLSAVEIADLTADQALAAALEETTDRTPLAISEVIRALAVDGSIGRTPMGGWRVLTPHALDRAVELATAGQRRAIEARITDQSAAQQELLTLLSLIAREVPARILANATATAERAVLDALGQLTERGLARLGEQGWATAHDMVSDVVIARLRAPDRGRLHALLAGALQTSEAEPAELARHWLGAGDLAQAATAYARAAERALDSFADQEAASLATSGLAVAPSPALSASLAECRAQARARLGDIPGARDDLRAALGTHPTGSDRSRLLGRLARLASGADDLMRASELAEQSVVEAGKDSQSRAQALEIAAVLDMNLDRRERAAARAAEALTLYRQIGDAPGTARILDAQAMATFLGGDVREGTHLLKRVADLFEDSGDLVRVVTPLSTSGHGLVFADEPAEALARTSAALELARTLGHPEGQAYALWHRAEALAALGRGGEALEDGGEALAIAQRLGHRGWTATSWRALGVAYQSSGDLDSALHAFTESLNFSEHLDLFACWAAARSALVLIGLGEIERAEPLVERALAVGPPIGRYEARLAQVELAYVRADVRTTALARAALTLADAAGVGQGRARLAELAHRDT